MDKALTPKSPILLFDTFKLTLCKLFKFYSDASFNPFSVRELPIKFSFNVVNFGMHERDLVN